MDERNEHLRRPDELNELVAGYQAKEIDRRTFLKGAIALGLTTASIGAILAACGSGSEKAATTTAAVVGTTPEGPAEPVRGGIFLEGYDRDVQRMDPITALWWDAALYPATHEALFAQAADGSFETMLSDGWKVSDDQRVWTFPIRSGLTFHGGQPCDAAAVAASFNVTTDPAGGGFIHTFFAGVDTVEAVGDSVVFRMKHPFANFMSVANNGFASVFHVETRKALGGDYGLQEEAGTGPFVLEDFAPGSHLDVSRWDEYPGSTLSFIENKGPAYVDGIRWVVLTEPSTRAQEIEAGAIDALHGPAWQDVQRLKDNPGLVVVENVEWGHYFMGLDSTNSELGFDDVRVRQAISHAIDREAIVDAILFGFGEPAYSIVPTADPFYDPATRPFGTLDLDKSKALLEDAGWTLGDDGVRQKDGKRLSFEIIVETDAVEQLIAQAVSGGLSEVGIDMSFVAVETGQWWERVGDETGYMFRNLWTNMIDGAMLWMIAEMGLPPASASIPALDAGYEDWRRAGDAEALATASRSIQLVAAEELPIFPIVTPANIWVHKPDVRGWTPLQPNLYPLYQDVWLDR